MKSESRRRASISKSQSARRNSSERRRSISRHLSYMRPNRRLSSIGKEMSVKQANQSIHQWLQAEFLAKDSPFLVFLSHPSVADADLINALSAREPVDSIRQRIESCVAQLNRDRLVNKLIVDGMLSELGLLIDAGVSVGRPRRVGVVQFSHLDLAGAQYDLYPSDRAFDIVLLLAQHTPRATSLPALASLIRHVNLTADQIEALAMAIVSGNADGFLLTTILTLANVLQQSGVDVVSHRQRLQRTATRLTHVATGILVDMKSDRLVSIALEAKDDDGQSPIDVALQTNNVAFMSSDVVVRFMTRVWTSSRYLDQPVGTARLHHLVLWDPYSLFKSNVVRYGMRVLLYIAFAAFVSWSAVGRLSATDPIRWFEIVYWVAAIGFLIDNVQSANRTGWASFFMSGWHHTDALGCVVIVAIALFRAASRGSDGSLIAGQVAFNGLVSAIVLILWVGLAQQFVLIPPVGTLMRTFSMHARSLVTLVVVASAFVLGFSTALVATVGEGVPEFGTLQRSVLTLYRGALSMFSFVPFTQMRTGEPAVGQTAFAIYLLIMTVIVCRTLVVVGMKSTIASMRATALSGFRFDFGKTCWDLHRRNAHLPPPLNLVVYLTYPAVALVLCTRQQWTGRQSHDKGADLWICYHCHHCNPALDEAHAEAELKKWIKDVEGNVSGALECLPARSAEQCRRCSMLKRTIAPADLTLERISLFYFIVLVWVPTAIVLVIPFGLWQALSRRRARVSKSRAPIASPGAFVKTRSPAEQDLDNARRAWVEGVHRKLQSQRYPSRGA